MECFAKIVNGYKSLIIFVERSILEIWQGSQYASEGFSSFSISYSIDIYLLKVNNRNRRTKSEKKYIQS